MKNRKILSAVITAAILVGSVAPSYTVFAESSWTESTAAARAAVEVGTFDALKTAVQTANAQINVTATITVTESIDLNGATLTATRTKAAFGARMIHITGSNVTISNGTINANDIDTYVVDVSDSSGNMTSNSATLSGVTVLNENLENTGYPSTVTAHSIIRNYGTLTLNSCTVKAGSPAAVKSEEGATLNVKGGSITGKAIGITTYGTTTLSDGATVSTTSGTNALYVLTYGTYDSKTTVNDATVTGTIVYGASSGATKAPEVDVKAAATLVKSGYTKATNATMATLPAGVAPTLTIAPEASVQLASTTGLDPILVAALENVEDITDTAGNSLEVSGTGVVKKMDPALKVPSGYAGLTLTANAGGDIYGVTMTEAQLKALGFSEANPAIGRNEAGYYPGFHVDALDVSKNGGVTPTYQRTFTYVADLNDATIKGLTYAAGSSTDGQFWPCIKKSYLGLTGKEARPILVYAIKAAYSASDVMYYYIAVDLREIPEDFAFDDTGCTGTHTTDTVCPICGTGTFGITVDPAVSNGSVAIAGNTASAKNGTEITVTATPETGYVLDKITVTAGSDDIDVTVDAAANTGTFTMPAKAVTVSAAFKAAAVAVESVSLDQTEVDLKVGESVTLTPTVAPATATDKTVTWSSDKPEIAKVENGKVTAVAAGEATITVTTTDGKKTATCKVTVTEEKKDETVTLKAGEQKTLVTKTDAAAKTRTENTVLVIPAETAKNYAGVKVTVKAGEWTKTSGLIKTCFAKIIHTDANGVKTTADAGSDFLIAVEVTDIPDTVQTVTYSFAPANE